MAALVTIHNDGPDEAMVRIGRRWVRLAAGDSTRTNATDPITFEPLPKLDAAELALHLGRGPEPPSQPPCRVADDS